MVTFHGNPLATVMSGPLDGDISGILMKILHHRLLSLRGKSIEAVY
jgi:hypothetical protein